MANNNVNAQSRYEFTLNFEPSLSTLLDTYVLDIYLDSALDYSIMESINIDNNQLINCTRMSSHHLRIYNLFEFYTNSMVKFNVNSVKNPLANSGDSSFLINISD